MWRCETWRGEMKMVLTLPPFQGVMSTALQKSKKELLKQWKQERNSRNSGEEKGSEEGVNKFSEEWAGMQMGQEQGELGSCTLYQSFICFCGRGAIRCVWWKSFTASSVLVSFEAVIHSFSSEGNPFQATRYSMFPCILWRLRFPQFLVLPLLGWDPEVEVELSFGRGRKGWSKGGESIRGIQGEPHSTLGRVLVYRWTFQLFPESWRDRTACHLISWMDDQIGYWFLQEGLGLPYNIPFPVWLFNHNTSSCPKLRDRETLLPVGRFPSSYLKTLLLIRFGLASSVLLGC